MFPLAFELRQDVTLGFGEPQAASGIERSFSWVTGTGLTTCLVPGLHEGLSSFSLPWEELAVQIERGFVYSVFFPWPIWRQPSKGVVQSSLLAGERQVQR